MKVVLLNDQLKAGGAERVLITIANLLYAKGLDVSIVLFLDKSTLDEQLNPGIPVQYLKRKGRFDLRAMKLLKHFVKGADIVHVHSRYNLRYFIVAKYLLQINKPKLVFHEHIPEYKKIDAFTLFILRKVDAYVAVLKSICDWGKSIAKIPSAKIHYLPNIVSDPAGNLPVSVVAERRIIMTGNFRKIKNHLFAIKLMDHLSTDFYLDLYGIVDEEPYFETLQRAISESKSRSRIKIIQGENNIYQVLHNYYFAIHPAVNETGPLVLLEYLKFGLPFLTYKTGDVVNNIQDEIPEMVIDTLQVEDWKNRIESTMLNNVMRQQLQLKMKEIVQTKFSSEAYTDKLLSIYNAVLA